MTQTVQPYSSSFINNTDKNLNKGEVEAEDDITLLISLFESMEKLSKNLSRLNNILHQEYKIIEAFREEISRFKED